MLFLALNFFLCKKNIVKVLKPGLKSERLIFKREPKKTAGTV